VLIPILYLKGVSTGDFEEALIALLGKDAGGLSASTISRLKEAWAEEHAHWSRHDRSGPRSCRLRAKSAARRRRCAVGFAKPSATRASERV
jgi:hypothetical protein